MKFEMRAIALSAVLCALPLAAFAQDSTSSAVETTEAAPAPTEAPGSDVTTEAPPAAPSQPSETTSAIAGAPPAGQGLVVFFRPSRFTGGAATFTAREGETEIGRLANDRYFVHAADPGIHEYNIRGGETVRIEVEEGESYYLQLNIAMGLMSGRGVLAPSDKATFESEERRLYTPAS